MKNVLHFVSTIVQLRATPDGQPRRRSTTLALLLLAMAMPVATLAGDPPAVVVEPEPPVPPLFKPTLDSRLRYEFGSQEGLEDSHAGTWRNRIGVLTREIYGFQLFAEYEGTLAVDRDSYRAPGVSGPANRTVIADPESHELNQLWGSYSLFDGSVLLKAGRQGINLGNQRFVGTVAWRQNMQTFDAATVTLKPVEGIELYYGYVWRVNRIFGSQVDLPPLEDFEGSSHLIQAKFGGLPFGVLTVYAYLLDLGNEAGDINSNNTFGAYLAGGIGGLPLDYYVEYAWQNDAYDSPLDYGTHYAHGALTGTIIDTLKLTLGLEYLGSDNGVGFKTPLATAHKFNGFADRFLATPAVGLSDLYVSLAFPLPVGVKGSLAYHHFWDADFGLSLGNEVDMVLVKSLGKGVTILAKGALFEGENGQPDTARASIELGFVY